MEAVFEWDVPKFFTRKTYLYYAKKSLKPNIRLFLLSLFFGLIYWLLLYLPIKDQQNKKGLFLVTLVAVIIFLISMHLHLFILYVNSFLKRRIFITKESITQKRFGFNYLPVFNDSTYVVEFSEIKVFQIKQELLKNEIIKVLEIKDSNNKVLLETCIPKGISGAEINSFLTERIKTSGINTTVKNKS
ncbi:MAG: hypothetical protein ACYTE8_03650 [Planctomycetota bacterium]|jgi:hypothetical protein